MQENVNIPDSTITTNLSFRQLVLMNMQQLTNFPYIEKDFDALTDYELLCLVVKFLNDVIANQNEQNDSITRMYQSFLALQDYVNNTKDELEDAFNNLDDYVRNYFDNLDVQEEINNKLDEMLEDGVLTEIIQQFLQSTAVWCFDTNNDLILATNLINGSYARTLGYSSINDNGGGLYKITNTLDNTKYQVLLNSGLYAELIPNEMESIKVFGGDSTGVTSSVQSFINANKTNVKTLLIDNGDYLLDGTINLSKNLKGFNGRLIENRSNEDEFCIEYSGNNLKIDNLSIHAGSSNKLFAIKNSTNIIISNCKFTSELNRTSGGLLDIYQNNKNILVENCYFETHTTGAGGIWVREGTTNGLTDGVTFNNCTFIGDTADETIAIWGWKGTIQNVHVINSSITRPLNTNVSNSFSITIGQSGITKNSGFENCIFDIYQANSCVFHVGYTDDKNLYLRNCVVNTYMQTLSNGITNLLGATDGFIVENCKFNLLNETANPTIANNTNIKYKNCEFNSQTQIELSIANIENCIINNNPLASRSGTIARTLYAKNCVFNHINNTSTHLIRCLNTNDSIKIENCTFNYESTSTNTNFVQATGTNYSETLPLIIKDNIFKGRLYVDSANISSGYVIGNYIGYDSKGYLSSNVMDLNNEINFTY